MATSKLYVDPEQLAKADKDEYSNAFARIENHYFVNTGFMRDGQLLERQEIDKIRHIPCVIVQGRYDVVCPATTAWALKKVWEEAEFHMVPDAGHASSEPGTQKLLVQVRIGYNFDSNVCLYRTHRRPISLQSCIREEHSRALEG